MADPIFVNPLKTKVLITAEEVIYHAPTDGEVDVRLLNQSIIIAERRFIKPLIGDSIYETLVNKKNYQLLTSTSTKTIGYSQKQVPTYDGDYLSSIKDFTDQERCLWKDYLHKIIAECVYFCALPTSRSRMAKSGVMQENPKTQVGSGGSTTVDLKDLQHLMDSALLNRIYPLIEDMHKYMCKVKYTGYTRDCGCDSQGTPYQRRSGIITSLYEDDDD